MHRRGAQNELAHESSAPTRIVQVKWTKAQFEMLNYSIVEFATSFIQANQIRGISVTHKSVVCYWNLLVWTLYGEGSRTGNRLESQVNPPQR